MTDKMLSIENFLSFMSEGNLKETKVYVRELGGWVTLKEMTAEARDDYEQSLFQQNEEGLYERNLKNARAKLVAACTYGPDGRRIFKTPEHIQALGNMPATIVDNLFNSCQQVNKITDQDVEELVGN